MTESSNAPDAHEIAASLETPERFSVIFARHYPAIREYLRRRIETARADDLAAETFLVAFGRRSAYDQAFPSARAWLFGIAVNLLHRDGRQERRQLRAYARFGHESTEPPASGADASLLERTLDANIARALRSLSRGDRDVLFLYACADLSYEEIAQALAIPTGTVRSRLSRARRQVRELLEGEGAIEGDATFHPEVSKLTKSI